jgi:hypothetical protein
MYFMCASHPTNHQTRFVFQVGEPLRPAVACGYLDPTQDGYRPASQALASSAPSLSDGSETPLDSVYRMLDTVWAGQRPFGRDLTPPTDFDLMMSHCRPSGIDESPPEAREVNWLIFCQLRTLEQTAERFYNRPHFPQVRFFFGIDAVIQKLYDFLSRTNTPAKMRRGMNDRKIEHYRGVVCGYCRQPIPLPAIVERIAQGEGEFVGREKSGRMFNLRCRACEREMPYRTSDIVEFEGSPRVRSSRTQQSLFGFPPKAARAAHG